MKQLLWLLLAWMLVCPLAANEQAVSNQKNRLQQLSEQIQSQQAQLANNQIEKDKLQKALRASDRAVSRGAKALRQRQNELDQSERKLTQLNEEKAQLKNQQQQQQEQLANQLRAAWMTGTQDHTSLLLGNTADTQRERLLVYYQYLNKARVDAIDALKQTEIRLSEVAKAVIAERDNKAMLLAKQKEEQEQQRQNMREQQGALEQIDQQLANSKLRLSQMMEDREVLETAIEQALEALAQSQQLDGLANAKGKLPWPIQGKLRKSFGSHREGQLRWNGWLVDAPSGRKVNAIDTGQVVFADWLRGFGLVIVIDHGQQYLSIYGHAQAVLKQVGDGIRKGETIALTGRSGGLSKPGLYFEIRHRGRAVDPANYLNRI